MRNCARMLYISSWVLVNLNPRDLTVEHIPQLNLAAYAVCGWILPITHSTPFKVRTNVLPVIMLFFLLSFPFIVKFF